MLIIEEGIDYTDVDETQLPYELRKNLGHGGSCFVEAVYDKRLDADFARKRMNTLRTYRHQQIKAFLNEVSVIRALGVHPHIIEIFASYTTEDEVALILRPVANGGDLRKFLNTFWKHVAGGKDLGEVLDTHWQYVRDMRGGEVPELRPLWMVPILEQAFGCLAFGLAFIHRKSVRHKDVKPGNILIHNGRIIYTDFGCSFDSTEQSRSTTDGRPEMRTVKYSAPEVLQHDKRNSSSDLYSLGCVFIELYCALTLAMDPGHISCFSASMDSVQHQLCPEMVSPRYSALPAIIERMTKQVPSRRLCAMHTAGEIRSLKTSFCCSGCEEIPIETTSKCVMIRECITVNESRGALLDILPPRPWQYGYATLLSADTQVADAESSSNLQSTPALHNASQPDPSFGLLRQNTAFFRPIADLSNASYGALITEQTPPSRTVPTSSPPANAQSTSMGDNSRSNRNSRMVEIATGRHKISDAEQNHTHEASRLATSNVNHLLDNYALDSEIDEQDRAMTSLPTMRSETTIAQFPAQARSSDTPLYLGAESFDSLHSADKGSYHGSLGNEHPSKAHPVLLNVPENLGDIKQRYIRASDSKSDLEALDSRYRRISKEMYQKFYVCGRVFKMLSTVPEDVLSPGKTRGSSHYSIVRYGPSSFCEFRIFLVVQNEGIYSRCLPLQTYRGQGATRLGLNQQDHGVAYTSELPPENLPGERLTKYPVRVLATGTEVLETSTRINYGRPYGIDHRTKVLEIGMVIDIHRYLIKKYCETATAMQ